MIGICNLFPISYVPLECGWGHFTANGYVIEVEVICFLNQRDAVVILQMRIHLQGRCTAPQSIRAPTTVSLMAIMQTCKQSQLNPFFFTLMTSIYNAFFFFLQSLNSLLSSHAVRYICRLCSFMLILLKMIENPPFQAVPIILLPSKKNIRSQFLFLSSFVCLHCVPLLPRQTCLLFFC